MKEKTTLVRSIALCMLVFAAVAPLSAAAAYIAIRMIRMGHPHDAIMPAFSAAAFLSAGLVFYAGKIPEMLETARRAHNARPFRTKSIG